MIFGQAILVSPIMIGLTITALASVSPQIKDTAKSLGATEMQIIITVIKEARVAVMAAVLLGFGRALSEVGVAMMIGGNIRGYTRVLTTSIALETSMGNLELSMALGIILISISLAINLLLNRFQREMRMAFLEVRSLSKSIGSAEILKGIDLTVERGEILGLIGPTGSGKTTLLRLVNLLDEPSTGSILFDGREVPEGRRGRSFPHAAEWPWSFKSRSCSRPAWRKMSPLA